MRLCIVHDLPTFADHNTGPLTSLEHEPCTACSPSLQAVPTLSQR